VTFVRAMTPLMLVATLGFVLGCAEPGPDERAAGAHVDPADYVWPEGPNPTALVRIEGLGEIEIELYPTLAPSTVKNFTTLASKDFYAGTTFHRVIPGFMIQGGDPNSKDEDPSNDGGGGPGWHIQDEFTDAPHLRGVLSMANTGSRNSGSSQFFFLHGDAPHLNGKHSVFGRVTKGMEVLDAIAAVETDEHGRWGPAHRPLTNVVVADIEVRKPGSSEAGAVPNRQAEHGESAPRPDA
jgi:peptidyl-prolyl cis-trans isomerase B (cyclophilin B)